MKKKRRIPPELWQQWARTERLLQDRIAYHERKIAEREAQQRAPES
jgi:hypothetical protein